jgi:hypothetical protein
MAALKITGRAGKPPDFHFHVAHPCRFSCRWLFVIPSSTIWSSEIHPVSFSPTLRTDSGSQFIAAQTGWRNGTTLRAADDPLRAAVGGWKGVYRSLPAPGHELKSSLIILNGSSSDFPAHRLSAASLNDFRASSSSVVSANPAARLLTLDSIVSKGTNASTSRRRIYQCWLATWSVMPWLLAQTVMARRNLRSPSSLWMRPWQYFAGPSTRPSPAICTGSQANRLASGPCSARIQSSQHTGP